jgi:DNA-binding CsgD family transcriptional regulator
MKVLSAKDVRDGRAYRFSDVVPDGASDELERFRVRGLGLSPREAEVLSLLALGQRTREVAAAMSIRPRTVYKHTQHIHSKLGTSDRAQAIATALAAEHEPGMAA